MLRGVLEGCRSAIPVSFGTDSDDFVPIPRGAPHGPRVGGVSLVHHGAHGERIDAVFEMTNIRENCI